MWTMRLSRMTAVCCGLAIMGSAGCGSREERQRTPSSPGIDRSSPTSSAGTLTEEDIESIRVGRVEELLEGRVSGLQVIRLANGEFSLRIRGVNSLSGNNEPLIVLDGMPVNQRAARGALAGLNPRDIARIRVLKDAGSTAIYGMRGANGVILIDTKRNNRNNK